MAATGPFDIVDVFRRPEHTPAIARSAVATGSRALWLQGEIEPGIAVGRLLGGRWPGLPVMTKAGGFGTDQSLPLAINRLHTC
mgnify:CR=1 FL=1